MSPEEKLHEAIVAAVHEAQHENVSNGQIILELWTGLFMLSKIYVVNPTLPDAKELA